MRKKVLAILLATSLCMMFTACGGKNTSDTDIEETSVEETVDTEEEVIEGEGVVELGQYKGVTVNVTKNTFSEEEVIQYRDYLFAIEAADINWNKSAETGDTLTIDFVGKIDGEAFEGGSDTDYNIVIGSNTFIEGFEDAMIGMVEGEVRDLDLKFPDTYRNTELAGKPCVFTVTCKKIVPGISDEAVAALQKEEFSTAEEFTEYAKVAVDLYNESNFETNVIQAVLEKIIAATKFGKLPEDKLSQQIEFVAENYASVVASYGVDLDTYFSSYGTTLEEVASVYVKRDLVFAAIAELEGFDASDEEVEQYVNDMLAVNGSSVSANEFFETESRDNYKEFVVYQKVYDLLLEETIVEQPTE